MLVTVLVIVNVPGVLKQCTVIPHDVALVPSPNIHVAVEQFDKDVSINATQSGSHPDNTFADINGAGCCSTVTVTADVVAGVPQLSVTVTVYEVVAAGVATGLEIVGSLRPITGDHM